MQLGVKQKIGIALAACVVVAGVIVWLVLLPALSDIATIRSAIYQERVDLEKKYERGQLLRQTLQDFEAVEPSRSLFSQAFLPAGQELELVTRLEDIAARRQVTQDVRLEPAAKPITPNVSGLNMAITLQGTFSSVMSYLQELEALPTFVLVQNLTLGAAPSSRGAPNRTVNVLLQGVIPTLKSQTN